MAVELAIVRILYLYSLSNTFFFNNFSLLRYTNIILLFTTETISSFWLYFMINSFHIPKIKIKQKCVYWYPCFLLNSGCDAFLGLGALSICLEKPVVPMGKVEYLWRYSFFSEKLPVERPVPFDFPPERPVFPNKWKAPLIYLKELEA